MQTIQTVIVALAIAGFIRAILERRKKMAAIIPGTVWRFEKAQAEAVQTVISVNGDSVKYRVNYGGYAWEEYATKAFFLCGATQIK